MRVDYSKRNKSWNKPTKWEKNSDFGFCFFGHTSIDVQQSCVIYFQNERINCSVTYIKKALTESFYD